MSSAVVALAFIGQLTGVGQAFFLFSLALLPALVLLGVLTYLRLVQTSVEDLFYARAINRIRRRYLDLAPDAPTWFVLHGFDDPHGVMASMGLARPEAAPSHRHLLSHTATMVLVVVVLLRGQIADRIPFLKSVKAPGFEAVFEAEVAAVRLSAERIKGQVSGTLEGVTAHAEGQVSAPPERDRRLRLNSRGAVLQAFAELEIELRQAGERAGIDMLRVISPGQVNRYLQRNGHLDPPTAGLLRELTYLRNQAAHVEDFDVSLGAVDDYVESVEKAKEVLRNIPRQDH